VTTADRTEQRNLERMRAVVEELRQVQARRDELLAQRHDLAAQLIATGNWSFSALAVEMGYERTQLAVEFRRRTKQAEKRREAAR
jgi:AraC-like DNA-binding protein